jgi:hypothetical protein
MTMRARRQRAVIAWKLPVHAVLCSSDGCFPMMPLSIWRCLSDGLEIVERKIPSAPCRRMHDVTE